MFYVFHDWSSHEVEEEEKRLDFLNVLHRSIESLWFDVFPELSYYH